MAYDLEMGQRTTIALTSEEKQTLRQWARAGTGEHRMVERAKVILFAHRGKSNLEIAEELNAKARPRVQVATTFR